MPEQDAQIVSYFQYGPSWEYSDTTSSYHRQCSIPVSSELHNTTLERESAYISYRTGMDPYG
ncbi:hypothetical protein BDR04DRAFT_1089005 [Suillus decipiens]|nr:hypothetical protein BDR04DRAFT_1089005 [Suillus decipiens]